MKNVFRGAKIGDRFILNNGNEAIFGNWHSEDRLYGEVQSEGIYLLMVKLAYDSVIMRYNSRGISSFGYSFNIKEKL